MQVPSPPTLCSLLALAGLGLSFRDASFWGAFETVAQNNKGDSRGWGEEGTQERRGRAALRE